MRPASAISFAWAAATATRQGFDVSGASPLAARAWFVSSTWLAPLRTGRGPPGGLLGTPAGVAAGDGATVATAEGDGDGAAGAWRATGPPHARTDSVTT